MFHCAVLCCVVVPCVELLRCVVLWFIAFQLWFPLIIVKQMNHEKTIYYGDIATRYDTVDELQLPYLRERYKALFSPCALLIGVVLCGVAHVVWRCALC